jgi:hypothetical protein
VTAGGDPLTPLAAAGAQRIGDPSIHLRELAVRAAAARV